MRSISVRLLSIIVFGFHCIEDSSFAERVIFFRWSSGSDSLFLNDESPQFLRWSFMIKKVSTNSLEIYNI